MTINTKGVRLTIILGAVVFLIISFILAFFVIPDVRNDAFPKATPEKAIIAFWFESAINFLISLGLLFIYVRSSVNEKSRPGFVLILGIISLLANLPLLDAAGAFSGHGPSLATVTVLLFICAIFGSLAGVSQIVLAILVEIRKLNT